MVLDSVFDENRSLWLADKAPYVPSPPLERDRVADVVIVGGGFTGVSTAYHLSERFPELGVILLEARAIANGASGRNGGQMLNWVHGFEAGTEEESRRIYDATREAIDGVHAIIEAHRLDVPTRRAGHLEVVTDPRKADRIQRELEKLRSGGIPLRFLPPGELRELIELEGVEGAVFDPSGGQLDGLAYLRGLRPILEARGIEIYEGTRVTRIREGKRIEVATPRAAVTAGAIVLATNAYTPHLGYFRFGLVPLHSHVLGTDPLTDEQWAELGWKSGVNFVDDRDRLSYGTLTATGRVLFGGGSNASYHYGFGNGTSLGAGPGGRAVAEMRRQLLAYLPRFANVAITRRWSGPIALTLSRLCTMGVRGEHRNVFYALGYSGHGVTLANLSGRVLTDLYSGSDERWRGLPFFERKLRFIPGEPFRFLGYHAFTKLTGRSPRTYDGREKSDRPDGSLR